MKPRQLFFYVLVAAFVVVLVIAARTAGADDPPPTTTTEPQADPTVQGKTAVQWHRVAQRYLSRARSLRVAIRRDPEVSTAIGLACVTYHVSCATLWRKARCESHLWRYAHNPSGASGLLQFLGSTWRSTPYAGFSVFDPYANALAAAWMHANGRGGEWVCQ